MKKYLILILLILSFFLVKAEEAIWRETEVKFKWDRSDRGFCPELNQCLVSSGGNPDFIGIPEKWYQYYNDPSQQPRCINNSQYILDWFCEGGNWSSRTKQIALALIQLAEPTNNFVLYCDEFDKALNSIDYAINNIAVKNYFDQCSGLLNGASKNCVNNFCLLKMPQGVAFSTSLNIPINHSTLSFLKALNLSPTACDNVPSTSSWELCGEQPVNARIFYNRNLNALAWLPPETSIAWPSENIISKIKNFLKNLISKIFSLFHNPPPPRKKFDHFNETRIYDRIYYAVKGEKSIFAFFEHDQYINWTGSLAKSDYIGINYTASLPLNCDELKIKFSGTFCKTENGITYLAAQKDTAIQGEIIRFWQDLTSKLRLK